MFLPWCLLFVPYLNLCLLRHWKWNDQGMAFAREIRFSNNTVATYLNCHINIGFPQMFNINEKHPRVTSSTLEGRSKTPWPCTCINGLKSNWNEIAFFSCLLKHTYLFWWLWWSNAFMMESPIFAVIQQNTVKYPSMEMNPNCDIASQILHKSSDIRVLS